MATHLRFSVAASVDMPLRRILLVLITHANIILQKKTILSVYRPQLVNLKNILQCPAINRSSGDK